jgi:hypothetical protein
MREEMRNEIDEIIHVFEGEQSRIDDEIIYQSQSIIELEEEIKKAYNEKEENFIYKLSDLCKAKEIAEKELEEMKNELNEISDVIEKFKEIKNKK